MTPACVSGARVGVSLERLAFEKLGDGKEDSALLADVVDGEDVRMVQGRDGPRLPFEPNLQLRLSAEPLRHDLDRDLPVQPRVPSPIHLSHPARAERRENLIRAEPRSGPDHKSPTTNLHCPVWPFSAAGQFRITRRGDSRTFSTGVLTRNRDPSGVTS